MADIQAYKKGSISRRFIALLIDELLSIFFPTLLFSVFNIVLNQFSINIPYISFIGQLFIWIFAFFYYPILTWRYGATLGKKWSGLRVVDSTTYGKIGLGRAFLREWLGKFVSSLLSNLGYLWALIDKDNRAWHDNIARTLVVAVDSQGNLIPEGDMPSVSTGRKLLFWGLLILAILEIFILPALMLVYLFIAQPMQINGNAMAPNYTNGQYYFVNPRPYATTDPARGDVVIYQRPGSDGVVFISRIIGLPGDTIKISDGSVFINGQKLDESLYVNPGSSTYTYDTSPEGKGLLIPPGQYFMLSDNRQKSSDSRNFGLISKESIHGKVGPCYWQCAADKTFIP